MKKNTNTAVLSENQMTGRIDGIGSGNPKVGPAGPPRNRVTTTADMMMTLMNSASMNMPKRRPEYSVLKPPTSVPSSSARSKGGRPASATMPTTNTRNAGNSGMMNQPGTPSMKPAPDWAATMSLTRSEPV